MKVKQKRNEVNIMEKFQEIIMSILAIIENIFGALAFDVVFGRPE